MNDDSPSGTDPVASPPPTLSRRQVWLIVAGFPALYLLNSFAPWSMGLFRDGNQSWWPAFFVSVAVLHWTSVLAVVWTMRRNRQELRQIGFRMRVPGILAYCVVVIVVGVGLLLLRQTWPRPETLEPWMILYPVTLGEKIAWIGISLTAGFCEEFVYRGFAIRALQGRGWRTWQAVALAAVSFSLLHGIAGVILFPVYFTFGLLFAGLFLWTKRLTPVMYVHALFDVMAILAV